MRKPPILISLVLLALTQIAAQGSRPLEYLQIDVWPTLTQSNELLHQGRFDDAIDLLSNAIRTNPKNGYLFLQRAFCHLKKQDGQPILPDVKTAAALVPTEYIVHNGVTMLEMNHQEDEALKLIDDFISKKDDSEGSYFLRSKMRLSRNDLTGAFDDIMRSVRLEPFLDGTRVDQLLRVLEKVKAQRSATDRFAEAIEFLASRCKQFATAEYWEPYALLMRNAVVESAPTRCNDTLRKVIVDDISLLDKSSDYMAIQEMLDKLVATEPAIKALSLHSDILVSRGSYLEAIEDLTNAIQISDLTQREKAALILRRGKIYSLASMPEKSAADLKLAYSLDPDLKHRPLPK